MAKRRRLDPFPAVPPAADIEPVSGGMRPPIADMAGDAAATAALREVSDMMVRAREEGLLIQKLLLDAVDEHHLVRDRVAIDPGELIALRQSIAERGQQVPIEVTDLGEGRYGLISGWRRLTALRELWGEGVGPGTVLALVRTPETSAEAYRAMVEENEVRLGLSYYERARIAVKAAERGVFPDERAALSALFATASRPRRSKIGSFIRIVQALDGVLRFPVALGERLGLRLSKALEVDPGVAERLTQTLNNHKPADPMVEQALIAEVIAPRDLPEQPEAPAPKRGPRAYKREVALPHGMAVTFEAHRTVITGDFAGDGTFQAALEAWLRREGWQEGSVLDPNHVPPK